MAAAKVVSSKRLIGSDRVEGTLIFSREGARIGSVKRLLIEKVSGRVVYVAITLNEGETVTVPWGTLTYDTELGGYRTDITESELRGAPSFIQSGESESAEDSPLSEAEEEELHAHFRIPPYWRAI